MGTPPIKQPWGLLIRGQHYKQKNTRAFAMCGCDFAPAASNRSPTSWWLTTVFQIRSGSPLKLRFGKGGGIRESKWPKEISMSNESKGPRFCCLGYIEKILLHKLYGDYSKAL